MARRTRRTAAALALIVVGVLGAAGSAGVSGWVPPETRIEPGDLLYLMGSAADITRARERISSSVPA